MCHKETTHLLIHFEISNLDIKTWILIKAAGGYRSCWSYWGHLWDLWPFTRVFVKNPCFTVFLLTNLVVQSWSHQQRQNHTTTTTILRPLFRDHPGELVPEENFWTLWCKGRLTEADTPTIRLGALPSNRHHQRCGDCLEGKRENYQVCSVQYCVQQLCTVRCTHIWTD